VRVPPKLAASAFSGVLQGRLPWRLSFAELRRPSQNVSKTILRRLVLRFVWPPEASVFSSSLQRGSWARLCGMLGFTEFRGCLSSAISLFRFSALRCAPPRISSPHIALLCFASLRLASRLVSLSLTLLRCASPRLASRLFSPCIVAQSVLRAGRRGGLGHTRGSSIAQRRMQACVLQPPALKLQHPVSNLRGPNSERLCRGLVQGLETSSPDSTTSNLNPQTSSPNQ
jgi:hypothetical protein